MVDETTPKLALTKPEVGGSKDNWGGKINGNFDILDNLTPEAPSDGKNYGRKDAAWVAQGDFLIGSSRPIGQGVEGDIYFDTTTGSFYGPRLVSSSDMFAYPDIIAPAFDPPISNYEMGLAFRPSMDCILYGIRYHRHASYTSTQHYVALWNRSTQAQIVRELHTGDPPGAGWVLHTLSTPMALVAGTDYVVSVSWINEGYPYGGSFWPRTVDGILYTDGCFSGSINTFPTSFTASAYNVEPQIGPDQAAAWPLAVDLALQSDIGSAGIEEAPTDSYKYARQNAGWVTLEDVEEAPINGVTYGRCNDTWMPIPTEAEMDGTKYVRQNGAWVPLPAGISEAPADGQSYARYMNQWAAINTDTYTRGETNDTFVNVTGDTMTGFLNLHADPTSGLHAATKQYADTKALLVHSHDISDVTSLQAQLDNKAPTANPLFTGLAQYSTAPVGDNSIRIATTEFVKLQGYVTAASPTFTGDPKAPTPAAADNDTSIATTAFVKAQGYAPLASPTFTGDPKAPTPTAGDNDTSVATTAFVTAAIAAIPPPASGATIADAAPAGTQGKLWWNSANGNLYIYYDDGSSSQWVQINSVGT